MKIYVAAFSYKKNYSKFLNSINPNLKLSQKKLRCQCQSDDQILKLFILNYLQISLFRSVVAFSFS